MMGIWSCLNETHCFVFYLKNKNKWRKKGSKTSPLKLEGFSANGIHGYLNLSSSTQAARGLSTGSDTTTYRFRFDKDIECIFACSSASWLEIPMEVFKDDIMIGQEAVRTSVGWWASGWQEWTHRVSPAVGLEQLVGLGLGPPADLPGSTGQGGPKQSVPGEDEGHSEEPS